MAKPPTAPPNPQSERLKVISTYLLLFLAAWSTFLTLPNNLHYDRWHVWGLLFVVILDMRILVFQLDKLRSYSVAVYRAGLLLIIPAILSLLASADWVLGVIDASSFCDGALRCEPLTKIDALYFAVTLSTTVGFGDIHPVTQFARLIVTLQMILSFVITAVVIAKALSAKGSG